jgi:vancomycin resistance protein YoaR
LRYWAVALAVGRRGPLDPARLRAYLGGVDLDWRTRVEPAALGNLRAQLGRQVARPPREPTLRVVGTTPNLTAGAPGRIVDPAGSERALRVAIADPGATAVELPVVDHQPTVAQPAAEAAAEQVRRLLAAPLTVSDGDQVATLAPAELAGTVRATPANGQLAVSLDAKGLEALLRKRAPFAFTRAADARFAVSGRKVRVVPGVPGRSVDLVKATSALIAAGTAEGGTRRAELPVVARQPGFTTAEAKALGIRQRVSTYTTQFSASDRPRVHNIALIGAAVSNKIVKPGQVFSMNAATGERTAAKGYRTAHVILNGEIVDGLGGGVCQAGTTVFNAVFFGGYEVVQRQNHSLHISRYPMGRDATLNWPNKDLKFKNDTPYAVLIRATVTPASMTVSLYSTSVGNKVSFTTSGQSNWRSPPTRYEDDPTLAKGEERVEAGGSAGFDVTVHRTVTRNGKVVHSDNFLSQYIPWTRVVKRGTKAPEQDGKPAAKPDPAA